MSLATPRFGDLEAVCFDLDGTLVDAASCWQAAFAEVWPRLVAARPALAALGSSDRVYDLRLRPYIHAAHAEAGGGEWDDTFVRAGFERLLAEHDGPDDALAREAAEEYLRRQNGRALLYPDAAPVLDRLAGRVRLALISNGLSRDQRAKIESAGIGRYFDAIVISEEVGLLKPDEAIFRYALDLLEVSPQAALYVGDNREHDVAGAKAAQMASVWIDRHGLPFDDGHEPDAVIHSLEELPPLLGLDAMPA